MLEFLLGVLVGVIAPPIAARLLPSRSDGGALDRAFDRGPEWLGSGRGGDNPLEWEDE